MISSTPASALKHASRQIRVQPLPGEASAHVNELPLVSIITPCLNPGPRLERCIRNVAGLTYERVEHIVVDGGSRDGTLDLLRDAPGVRWISEPDEGQSQAINKGFRLAGGEVVTWLNADDQLVPDSVALAAEAFRGNPSLGFVYGDCEVFEQGQRTVTWRARPKLTARAIEAGEVIPQAGAFIAAWALERVGDLDETFHLAMDVDLWIRLVDAGIPSAHLRKVTAIFELHELSKSGSIPRFDFFEEQARAFAKSGRPRAAALALGRGAATGALDGNRVGAEALAREVERAYDRGRALGELRRSEIEAAARAEAAVLELKSSPAGLRHLFASGPWRLPETRARLLAAARRGYGTAARAALRLG
jgi:GT2 family glycosyltransferase